MKKAFTLVELLIVIIIIGILATMAIPQYQKMVNKARFSEAKLVCDSVAKAAQIYYLEHGFYTVTPSELDVDIPVSKFADKGWIYGLWFYGNQKWTVGLVINREPPYWPGVNGHKLGIDLVGADYKRYWWREGAEGGGVHHNSFTEWEGLS